MQGFIQGLHHINERHMTARDLKLIMVVYMCGKAFNGLHPDKNQIAAIAHIKPEQLEPELTGLVEKRYLHEIVPIYGEMKLTYKLGSMGGTLMKHIVKAA